VRWRALAHSLPCDAARLLEPYGSHAQASTRVISRGRARVGCRSRIGNGKFGIKPIMAHPFFKGLKWDALEKGELVAPFIPNISVRPPSLDFPNTASGSRSVLGHRARLVSRSFSRASRCVVASFSASRAPTSSADSGVRPGSVPCALRVQDETPEPWKDREV